MFRKNGIPRWRRAGMRKCHERRMRKSGQGNQRAVMFRQKSAPRQLLLHCSSTDIRVGMPFLHFRHPCDRQVFAPAKPALPPSLWSAGFLLLQNLHFRHPCGRQVFCSCKTCTSAIPGGRIPRWRRAGMRKCHARWMRKSGREARERICLGSVAMP